MAIQAALLHDNSCHASKVRDRQLYFTEVHVLFAIKSTGLGGVFDWTGHATSWPKSVCVYTAGGVLNLERCKCHQT